MKKTTMSLYGKDVPLVRNNDDLNAISLREQALAMWKSLAEKWLANLDPTKQNREGCCILGHGIEIAVLEKRARKACYVMFIRQGNLDRTTGEDFSFSATADEVVAFLNANGLTASYNCGRMD